MKKKYWVQMPHPGHFIGARECKFFLNTRVGDYIVSTVGEYLPPEGVREIFAKSRGVTLEGKGDEREADYMKKLGYEDLGFNRKYETMVFPAKRIEGDEEACCEYRVSDHSELDMRGYSTAEEAVQGHWELCEKWAEKDKKTFWGMLNLRNYFKVLTLVILVILAMTFVRHSPAYGLSWWDAAALACYIAFWQLFDHWYEEK